MYKPKISSLESPFLYLLGFLIAGILSSRYFVLPTIVFWAMLIVTGLMFKLSKTGTDLCILVSFFCLGNVISTKTGELQFPDTPIFLNARCEKVLNGNNYILSSLDHLFYLSNSRIDSTFQVGDSLALYARVYPFRSNANSHEFNFSQFMQQLTVYHRLQPTSPIKKTGHSTDLYSFFEQQRSQLLEKTATLSQDSTSIMLINALCLGYKNDLSPQLRNLFIQTGTIHLLAVSGLHVGIIYLLIVFIIKYLHLYGPRRSLLALPLLWSYALLTGLSPSVVRATLLLSFVDIGKVLSRTYNPVNILAASACLTLVIQPTALYSLSFLLSYSAYCGILILFPYLNGLFGKLPKFLSVIYTLICLTLAAQLPTLPLSAYFFHTVNINGFLTNLIAVPLATILLYSSAICLILPISIGIYIMPICKFLCHTLIEWLQLTSPYIINLHNLYPSGYFTILIYITSFTLIGYLLSRKRHLLYTSIAFFTVMLLFSTYSNFYHSRQKEIVIFHYPRHSAILLNHNGFYLPLKKTSESSVHMRPYILYNKLKPLPDSYGILNNDISWQPPYLYYYEDTIVIPSGSTPLKHSANILIVTGNLTPQQLFSSFHNLTFPSNVILDGSNTFYTCSTWNRFCKEHNLIYRNTSEEGEIHLHRN